MLPTDRLSFVVSDEERAVVEAAHRLCRDTIIPVRSELDEQQKFPDEIFARFREIGLFGAMFEAEYGGLGASGLLPTMLLETVAEYCLGVATSFAASTGLAALPIRLGGTEEQRRRFLPKLASGEWIGALAVTEPEAGSDILALSTAAVKRGNRYVLNGTKQWITNAGRADLYCVFAATGGKGAISCFAVERGTPGLSFGRLEDKLGIRCSHTRQVILEDVELPEENLIGLKPDRGLIHLLETLTHSRVGVAALAVGLASAAYRAAADYAHDRRQFGQPIVRLQAVQHLLAEMLMPIEAARLLTYKASQYARDGHPEAPTASAIAKCYASDVAMRVATDAVQIHGGYGFVKDCPAEKMFRDAKVLAIYEGTNQMLKNQVGEYIQRHAGRRR